MGVGKQCRVEPKTEDAAAGYQSSSAISIAKKILANDNRPRVVRKSVVTPVVAAASITLPAPVATKPVLPVKKQRSVEELNRDLVLLGRK